MKKVISLIFAMIFWLSYDVNASPLSKRKYFVLEKKSNVYKVNVIGLKERNKPIELYNLLYDDSNLILFSILPINDSELWREVNLADINKLIINFEELKSIFAAGYSDYQKSSFYDSEGIKRQDISIVVNKGGKFYASNYCFSEYFYLISQKLVFPNLMNNIIINIQSPTLTVKHFEDSYFEAYGNYSPNSVTERRFTGTTTLLRPLEKPLLFRSGEIDLFNHKAYLFWQFTDWHINHGNNIYRGIDRFLYVPNIGIVAGAFDAFWDKPSNVLQKDYLEEKLISPSSIHDIWSY